MTSWNMPPGTNVTMIPGWDDPPDNWQMQIRCGSCGVFMGQYDRLVPTEQEIHYKTYHCKGGDKATCDNWHDCREEHDYEEYEGQTNWYKCPHCGAETAIKEF